MKVEIRAMLFWMISMPVFPVLPEKTGDGFTGFKESMEVAKPCLCA